LHRVCADQQELGLWWCAVALIPRLDFLPCGEESRSGLGSPVTSRPRCSGSVPGCTGRQRTLRVSGSASEP
jgi:hypothetical protein